ncbi:MarR family winged helix-turn-helix transcriptional regulator [Kitasatospora hibisci]|uniref:MarR family winged helix-turn-helix transcriptional regulator n=1 Tax=Kitasatospora hibisci TaxID=3369522 RepID=UPI003754BB3E
MSDGPPESHDLPPVSDWVEADLVTAVLTASRVLVAISARSLGDVADSVTLPLFRTLVVLHTRGPMTPSALAEQVAVSPSTLAGMIERLEVDGMVVSQAAELDRGRREAIVTLTEQGARTVTEVTERRRAEIARIVAAMPPNDRAGLVVALHSFARAASEPQAGPYRQPDLLGW